jgi:hypothetical protein
MAGEYGPSVLEKQNRETRPMPVAPRHDNVKLSSLTPFWEDLNRGALSGQRHNLNPELAVLYRES